MLRQTVRIDSNQEIAESLFLLKFTSRELAAAARPGQFVNIRTAQGWDPLLLRRPFSISRIVDSTVELFFGAIGNGTRILSRQRPGDLIDVLGPLGKPFQVGSDCGTAVMVAGGLGVAPFPFLTDELERKRIPVVTFVGSRSRFPIENLHLNNVRFATDDGTHGFRGNVVECLSKALANEHLPDVKIFGCGPTRMLKAVSDFAQGNGLNCELSLEGDMACGIGICQGCPVEKSKGPKKYGLVCTDGPTFDSRDIIFPS